MRSGFICALMALLAFAAAGCGSPPKRPAPADPLLVQLATSGGSAYALNSFDRAARFYRLALQRARALDDATEIGKQAYNLAAALFMSGKPAEALPYLEEAETAFAAIREDTGPILLLKARALRSAGGTNEALSVLQRVVELDTPRDVQAQGWLLFGHIMLDAGQGDEAEKALRRARSVASDDPVLRAGIAGLEARLAVLGGNPGLAAEKFDMEAAAFQEAGRYRDMADSLLRAGSAYAEAKLFERAGDRFYRAARSFYGQGDTARALEAIERALAAADRAPEAGWSKALAALFNEIRANPAAEPSSTE